MQGYDNLAVYYGDVHNHSGISYGHGTIEEAFRNARERLDFCSVTGHAHWPDMPAPDKNIEYIIDFHRKGFAKLKNCWQHALAVTERENVPGKFVTFPGFEVHSLADGDYTVLYRDRGEILYEADIPSMLKKIAALDRAGTPTLAFPHHIGYRQGRRGINWNTYTNQDAPIVEMISMHGCAETDENTRAYMHVMGPSDRESTMQFGLELGHDFGVIGSTDHHSSHPGSYGHGMCGVWASELTRAGIFDALRARRTYALTGDRIRLEFAIDGHPLGTEIPFAATRNIGVRVLAGAPIDYVDVLKNNRLLRRFSECDVPQPRPADIVKTLIFLELGWSDRKKEARWNVRLGIDAGRILAVEPRFRGQEVVSPVEKDAGAPANYHVSHWEPDGERAVRFDTVTYGNPNNFTNACQGMCLAVEMPLAGNVLADINGRQLELPLALLMEGARTGDTGWHTPAYRFHRAPFEWEFDWRLTLDDRTPKARADRDFYYVRVREKNDHWAWSSPIFVR